MALAFKRLRPLFRERGKINAEVTGRLTETLGGIRIVKAYAAEKREDWSSPRRAPALSQRSSIYDAVAGVTAFSTVIVGTIGVILILVGGRAILAGQMTLGDFFMYMIFTVWWPHRWSRSLPLARRSQKPSPASTAYARSSKCH